MHVLHTFANNDQVPYLSWFAERARERGGIRYTFLIMYPKRPAMLDEMQALGFTCEWIPYDDRHRKRGMLMALPRLWSRMVHHRPDIVHCHLFDDALPGLLAAWLAGVKIRVTTKQDTGFHWSYARKWVFFDRLVTRLATQVIAISGECRRFLIDIERAPASKITLVHNGIPPERFVERDATTMARFRKRFGLEGRRPVIGTVARFIAWKGHRHIIDAARVVVQRHPAAVFLFCGSGPLENEIRQAITEAGLQDHIRLTGWIDRSEMASFYGILDIYLHAAVLEPFGLVYPEAMMNGIPVVSTPTGAALDAIETDVNGILVPDASPGALAQGIERLLALDIKAIGQAGRETALRMYPFDVMWQGTMDLYAKALGTPR